MKIYISADMEGLAGVVTQEQLGPEGFEYERYREVMTQEVLAVIEGLRDAGANEFLVSDSHGNGQNLRLEDFPDDARVIRSWPRPLGMMEGIDESFAGAVLLGYHTGTHNARGVRAHTMSSAHLSELSLQGEACGETVLSAAIAGHFGVPILMLSGDDALADEVRGILPSSECCVTKRSISFHSAECLPPRRVQGLLRESAARSLRRRDGIAPFRMEGAVTLGVRYKCYRPAEVMGLLRGVERVDSHGIRVSCADILEASRFVEFLLNYEPGLKP